MKNLVILGSTGSVGRQTLDVVDWFPNDYRVVALTAHSNLNLLVEQVNKYHPQLVAIADERKYLQLKALLPKYQGQITVGAAGLLAAVSLEDCDMVVAAISGLAGLAPVLQGIDCGKDIAFANKEVLVAAGHLVMQKVREKGVAFLPVDSEHSAIFQCLGQDKKVIEKILLTASGGPFRGFSQEQLSQVTAKMALQHPTWSMGPKITVDSATLMNKGLEVIEARWLFDVDYDKIEVVVHPESIIHSMVQYEDGAVLAQLGSHDMRLPIQYALSYPKRVANKIARIDLFALAQLNFEKPDYIGFPCLKMAYEAGKAGATYPVAMNGANEELAWSFIREEIKFTDIAKIISQILEKHVPIENPDLEAIIATDTWSRTMVTELKREVGR